MFKIIKNFFGKKEEIDEMTAEAFFKDDDKNKEPVCSKCPIRSSCSKKGTENANDDLCKWIIPLPENFDDKKDSILIIDDNAGMVSFLLDDIEFFEETGVIQEDSTNVISISGAHAAFNYEALQNIYNNLNIKWAIIDITLGGSVMTPKGNVRYTGVDVYRIMKKYNPNAKFLFYTGNNLNPYIKSNEELMNNFKEYSDGEDIKKYVLYKTSMDMDNRRKYIEENLFGDTKENRRKAIKERLLDESE